jgi:pyrroline-5-carboxylate reductase
VADVDVVIVAVKPGDAPRVCFRGVASRSETLVLSIAG